MTRGLRSWWGTGRHAAENDSGTAGDLPVSPAGGGWQAGISYDDLSRLVLLVALGLVLLTFRDYGITNDEEVQKNYGQMILAFYTSGFHDLSALNYKDLFYYGGVFDVAAAVLNLFSPLGEYETRHLLGGLIGVLGLVGAWRTGRLLAGERGGFLAVALLALTPSYYGPAFNNPKDIPFAVGMLWTTLSICRLIPELPRPSVRRVLAFSVSLGLTLGVRVGGGLAGLYLLAVLLAYLVWRGMETRSAPALTRECRDLFLALAPGLPVAYVAMAIFWPWSWQAPLNPLVAVAHFTHYGINIDTLLDGQWVPAKHLPATYLPLYLAVKVPEMVLLGAFAALIGGVAWLSGRIRAKQATDKTRPLQIGLVVLAVAFPLVFFIAERPTAYNGIRHFAFILPPLAVVGAIGLDALWTAFARRSEAWSRSVGFAFCVAGLFQVWMMATLHPDEYVYFNALAGGVRGAVGKFELDYWCNSLAEAAHDLSHYVEMENGGKPIHRTYKVAICGDPLAAIYFMPPYFRFTTKSSEADFFLSFTQHDCDRAIAGREIIAVQRFGANLSVVKDLRQYGQRTASLAAAKGIN